ncbi:MAG: glycosyltransferase family 4 protein [Candidatus Bathyarchaeota archaeon]|nr:glycosyltransferase family 4 protein [Candidatus Bathyarchaeota archaeon]
MVRLAYAHDGISSYDELFLKSFKDMYEVYVLTFHPSPNYVPEGVKIIKMRDFIPEVNLHPFEGARKHLLTPLRAHVLKKTLDKVKPDVLVGCWASTYGFYSAYSNFHPFILFVWGSDVLVFPRKYFPLKPFVVYSLRKADVVVVDSEVQREAVINLGCEPSKIVQFPWVNLNGFKRNETQRRKIRRECGWNEDDIVVISLRYHRPIYGVEYLIDAIPKVLAKNKNVKFIILGEGPFTNTFKTKMTNFIKSGHVRFVDAVPHNKVKDYLSAADIYVSTSFSDGTSASLLEAMACSLSPVVTEIDGNKEWVKDGVNGLFVPVANSEKIAEKILLLASDYELRRFLGEKAVETVRARVNWQKNIQKLTKIIDKMINQF